MSNANNILDDDSVKWHSRFKWNCFIYIIIYGILGFVSAITNDFFNVLLNISIPNVVKRINIYGATSSLIVAVF